MLRTPAGQVPGVTNRQRPVTRAVFAPCSRCPSVRGNALRARAAPRDRDVRAYFTTGPSLTICEDGACLEEHNGNVLIRDDLDALLQALPVDIREPLVNHPNRAQLLEVVLDLGRRPEARFQGLPGGEYLRDREITHADLEAAAVAVGSFGADNRAGITGTLHRISCIRNRKGVIVGLTCRVGRAVTGHTDMIRDLVESGHSVLILGRPGVGKTTVIRELARVLADELSRRVVIVDSSNEIGGDGDVPHPAIGSARRMQVPDVHNQHMVMIEAVENHMPQVVIVDEISTEAEALACRTIAERGVVLIGTAHGWMLENLIKNPTLTDLVGGIQSVTLGDEEANKRGTQKTILERKAPPTFPIVVEIRERTLYVAHWVEDSVDALLQGRSPNVQVRERDPATSQISVRETRYDLTLPGKSQPWTSSYDEDYDAALRKVGRGGSANGSPLSATTSTASNGSTLSSDLASMQEGMEVLRLVNARRNNTLAGMRLGGSSFVTPSSNGNGNGKGGKGNRTKSKASR